MKRFFTITFVLAWGLALSQHLSTTFKPFVKEVPRSIDILECSDGNIFLYGGFETYGNDIPGKLVKVDSNGDPVAGFQNVTVDNDISSIFELPSGKILICGSFNYLNGQTVSHLVRINADGTLDDTFVTDSSIDINGFAVQSDGKIILVFLDADGYHLVRINENGSSDVTFNQPSLNLNGFSGVQLDMNDKIYYSSFSNLYRFDSEGVIDDTFVFNESDVFGVKLVRVFPDSSPLVIAVKIVSLTPTYQTTSTILKINADGSVDNNLSVASIDGQIYDAIVRQTGKLVIGGNLTSLEGQPGTVFELNDDGSYNQTLATMDFGILNLCEDSDQNLFVGGMFKTVNYIEQPFVAKIKPDKSIDTSFKSKAFSTGYPYTPIALQSGNRPLVGGGFDFVGVGENRAKLIRLLPNGSVDNTFDAELRNDQNNYTNPSIDAIVVQEDDKIIVGGSRLLPDESSFTRLLPDGQLDATFQIGSGPSRSLGVPFVTHMLYRDSTLYVFGIFDAFNGHPSLNFAILNSEGAWIGPAASPITSSAYLQDAEFQSDGKILLLGSNLLNGSTDPVVRLNADGSPDNSFHLTLTGNMIDMTVDASDNIWIGGSFLDFVKGTVIAKFDKDGVRDNSITLNSFSDESTLLSIVGLPDGNLAVGGKFNSFDGNPVSGLALLSPQGSLIAYSSSTFDVPSFVIGSFLLNGSLYAHGLFSENNGAEITSIRKVIFEISQNIDSLFADAISDEEIKLNWIKSPPGSDTLNIEISEANSSQYQNLTNASAALTGYDVTGLSEATTYYFRITAFNEWYAAAPLENHATTKLKPEVALPASNVTEDSFVANWEYIDGTDSVKLEVSKDGFNTILSGYEDLFLTTNFREISGLDYGVYQYRAARYRNGFSSEFSEPITVNVITGLSTISNEILPYPNPVSRYLTIPLAPGSQHSIVTVFTTSSLVVQKESYEDVDVAYLDMLEVAAGLYLVQVNSDLGTKVYKVIKAE